MLINLLHRGACGCEANTGDGAGIMLQLPDKFFRKVAARQDIALPPAGQYGTGMVFLPRLAAEREQVKALVERVTWEEGQHVLGWRIVPTATAGVGDRRWPTKPIIEQIFIGVGTTAQAQTDDEEKQAAGGSARWQQPNAFERKLYVIRKRVEHEADKLGLVERHAFYVPSLSSQTLIYKGMLIAEQVEGTFPDLSRSGRRIGAGDGASALQHQHVPVLAAGAPVPLPRPQRRDQHAARQHQLDARARGLARSPKSSATSCKKMLPDPHRRRQRLGDVRQRARVAGA